jgi:peroxiredoxin
MVLILASGCGYLQPSMGRTGCRSEVADKAEDICPILIGQSLPKIVLRTADNAPFDLNAAVAQKPTILIFFRGGWCPYCSLHLGQLQSIESRLVQMGFQIIAVSPDRPGILKAPAEKQELKYRLLSDSEMTAAKALGIAFRVDDTTVTKYKTDYGIDLEADSGQTHHLLPVPSAFVVGRDGVIQFSYVNPNYKVRIDPGVLLEAARVALRQSTEASTE